VLQDILLVYPPNDVDHSPVSPALPSLLQSSQEVDLSKALKWSKLQQANFKLNGIKIIDQSVVSAVYAHCIYMCMYVCIYVCV